MKHGQIQCIYCTKRWFYLNRKYDKNARFAFRCHICLLFQAKLNNNLDNNCTLKHVQQNANIYSYFRECQSFQKQQLIQLTVKIILRAKYMYYHQSFCISTNAPKFPISSTVLLAIINSNVQYQINFCGHKTNSTL